MTVDDHEFCNITRAAALLGVSRDTVSRWIRDGRLPAARLGPRAIRIRRADLDRLLAPLAPGSLEAAASRSEASGGAWNQAPGAHDHAVQFFESDAFLVEAVAAFIAPGLDGGEAAAVIATEPHRTDLARRLQTLGIDIEAAAESGRYVALDASAAISSIMDGATPHAERFARTMGDVIDRAARGGRRVRVFGEMVALLAADGNDAAAVRLEALWNDLQRAHPCALLCAYPMACLGGEGRSAFVDEICAVHSAVIPAESFAALATPSERQRAVAALQQKAESLDRAIAERHLVEDRLCDALAAVQIAQTEAGAAHQSRDEFLAIAAHELRNPLTGLSLHAQLALRRLGRDKTLAPEAVAHTLEAITSHAATLARLLDLLTDVSRLEAGDLVLRPRATDLTALVSRVVAAARARVAGREITLAAAPALQARVDPLRVEQVLANLLDNAIKSSPDVGTVDVSLSQPDTDLVELSVRDCGRGMPPETRDSLFERFSQAHSDDVGHGLGLGLYVSRQIVALHGGEIRAEFPPDGGSRFVVHLPVGMPISAPILVAD